MATGTVAKFVLDEEDALRLANAIDDIDILAALPVSLGEASGRHWQVIVYFSDANQPAEAAALLRVSHSLFGEAAPKFSIESLPDTDWVAKSLEGLPPVRAGRFLIYGSHDRSARRANDIGIEIEANQAFGTGHHGTTAGCLMAIDRLARTRPVANALDVGTGSGILAIAIAKTTGAKVLASDIDAISVQIARSNFRLNGVANRVRAVAAGRLDKRLFQEHGRYDLVVANILAEPLIALAPQICRHRAPGGTLILSGLLPNQRARVVGVYRSLGAVLVRSSVLNGWLTLTFQ